MSRDSESVRRGPSATWIRPLVWLAIGLIIYFSYSRYHSKVRNPSGVRS